MNKTLNLSGLRVYWIYLLLNIASTVCMQYVKDFWLNMALIGIVSVLGLVSICMMASISEAYRKARNVYFINLGVMLAAVVLQFMALNNTVNGLTLVSIAGGLNIAASIISIVVLMLIMQATAALCNTYGEEALAKKINGLRKSIPLSLLLLIVFSIAFTIVVLINPQIAMLLSIGVMAIAIWIVVIHIRWILCTEATCRHLHGKELQ